MKRSLAIAILFLMVIYTARATDYYVNASTGSDISGNGTSINPWLTITHALNSITGSGHILHVAEGYYDESLGESFPIYVKNGVSLDGAGDSLTVIDAGYVDGHSVFYCIGITDASTYVEGFFITGGYYYDSFTVGAGIYISAGSTLTIQNNTIYDNYLGTWGIGGGIYMINSSPKILNNLIAFNGSDYWGDGDAIGMYNSSPLIKGNEIIYNISGESSSSIYVEGSSSAPRFINNIIAFSSGAGIYCYGGVPTILNNTISDNGGCGIYLGSGCTPDSIINNIITYNSEYGIQESSSSYDPAKVWYNLFYANTFGLYWDEGSTAYFTAGSLNTSVAECENNIEGDPSFIDRYNANYHLSLYSPAIDSGDPAFPYNNEPAPNGSRINLGAYGNTAEAATSDTPPVLPADLYVDATAGSNTTGDGSSGNPWQTITYALSQIYTTGHTIHVATGTYNAALGESFPIMIKNGVSLSGEDNVSTIIDAEGSSSDYLQVINCIGITDASTFIEGFTITGGYLDYNSYGGGIYISAGSNLTISNNIITGNYLESSGYGAAIYIHSSSPYITGNILSNNTAYYGYGSSIALYNSSPNIERNTIFNNTGSGTYSCIYISGELSYPNLKNNVIAKNSGKAINCSAGYPTIQNNTISDNSGDGIYIGSSNPDAIVNNIISFNNGYGIYEGSSGDANVISYNLFYLNNSGLFYDEGITPYFTVSDLNSGVAECHNNIAGDPLFIDKAGDNYHEMAYSPAIDAGEPSYPYSNEPEDNGDRINIGAYGNTAEAVIHSDPPVFPTDLYVDASAGSDGTGDGSLGNPWKTITYALSQIYSTGHVILVASGTYNEALGEIFPINMKNGISLSGSDASTTIIDAGSGSQRVLNCTGITDASTYLENFTITGGYLSSGSNGGGIYISAGSALTISKNIIDNNYVGSSGFGGAIYITNSSPRIINNRISNNTAYYGHGGALSMYNSSPEIRGNSIVNNTGTGTYNAIYIYGTSSSPLLFRNVIAKNTGDGISVSDASPSIINNTISGNTSDGINLGYNSALDSVINNIISYNSGYGVNEAGSMEDPEKVWYNLFYANTSGLYYDEGNTEYYTVSSLNSGVAECANNIDGDPAFKDRTNNDYRLQSASAAIDTGDPNFPNDPDDSRVDIGAYYFTIPPPGAPEATAATNVGQTDFTANWNSAATATGYFLDVATDADFNVFVNNFEDRDVENLTSYSITGLSANTEYYYRVRAYNEGGSGPNSNVISLSTTVDPPAPPSSAPVVYAGSDITQTSFLTDWEPVDAATSYRIDVASEIDPVNYVSGYYDLEVLNATELTITGLIPNTNYYYWVMACNSGGCSNSSDTVIITTLPNPPPPPMAGDAGDLTQTSFAANWNSSGNADGYYLDVSEEDTFNSFVSGYNYLDVSNVTSYDVTGLTSNTTYYYRVEAYNTGGTGGYSETITVTTLPDPPPAPVANEASDTTQTSFTANWNSSATATGYFLDVAGDNEFNIWVVGGAYANLDVSNVTSYNVSGLSSNNTYYYRVTAYNEGGTSDYSDTKIVTTLQDPPPAPVAYEATDTTQTEFTAHWDHVATADFYLIDWSKDESFQSYSQLQLTYTTTYTLSGLEPNTTYYYRILAYNNGGPGDPSNVISVTTLQVPAPPAPVANNPLYVGQTDFTASWNSSETATGYYLDICYDSEFTSCNPFNLDVGNVTSYSIMELAANTTYYYRVSAYNDGGTSDYSNTITVTTLLNPPDPPAAPLPNDATDITQTSFTANWETTTNATGFLLDVSNDDVFSNPLFQNMDLSNTTSYKVTDLTAATTYYYRIRAYNSGGTSDYSGTITVTTLHDPPEAPLANDATQIMQTSFVANWESSERATGYNLDVATDDAFTTFVTGYENYDVSGSLSCSVNGLTLNTTYYYRVRAYNDGGESGNSNSITVTTLLDMPDLPDPPTADPATNITQTTFQANWTPASGTNGLYLDVATDNTFTSYVAGYENLDIGYDISLDISGLSSNTTYYYRLRGYNVSGTGNNSNVITVTTLHDPPPAPTGLSSSSCSNEVYLQWNQSTESDFMQYNVYWGTVSEPTTLYDSYAPETYNAITISDLTNGQTYYFRVTTVVSPGVESDYSTTTSVKVKTGVIPRIKSKWGKVLICYNPNDSLTSFQWFVGTSSITGETGQYYVTAGQSGFYYVVTSDQDGCYNHSNLVYISGSKSISVYPNPAKSNFTLNLSSDFMGETVVTLFNSTGVKSLEYRTEKRDIDLNCEIPVGNLKDGIYTIEVNVNDEEIEYTKLIIIE